MANITKRGDTYRIKVSCGYSVDGKQITKSTTYKPDPTKSEKWNEKELQRQAVLFEDSCKRGISTTAAKFENFAREWFANYAELKLKRLTLCSYRRMEKRTYAALGHIRIDKISPLDIQRFVRSLVAEGLSTNTVKNYVRFVSVILNYAVRKHLLTFNPCVTVDYPTAQETERDFYTVEEVKRLLALLWQEREEHTEGSYNDKKPFAMFFTLAAYTGARKGELLGLEWQDLDFDNNTLSINRAYYYSSVERTHYTDTPKTKTSRRTLKLPAHVMGMLKEYRTWQTQQKEICGGSWVDTDRVFIKWNGESMATTAPAYFLDTFTKRNNIRRCTVHSFRHFNASALINEGVDVVTVQAALGHSTAATTLSIYSHAFSNAQSKAMEAISNAIAI
ncbi:MAG: site-specific integrase [Defluviitaleaceae bacterium]|nr:site-specific integrase [Defluviitaleaceae bacterium]